MHTLVMATEQLSPDNSISWSTEKENSLVISSSMLMASSWLEQRERKSINMDHGTSMNTLTTLVSKLGSYLGNLGRQVG